MQYSLGWEAQRKKKKTEPLSGATIYNIRLCLILYNIFSLATNDKSDLGQLLIKHKSTKHKIRVDADQWISK